ncbi:hypothetical protein [Lewinella sp. IMCC34183]|uniref:hypothetical protein n=1 Tax=Lewinella sp. IMCC34183 TaxID=2248762 RepID=UPI000E241BDD|nr:hypothetical protein [Lewinella sp. IMCC34183]
MDPEQFIPVRTDLYATLAFCAAGVAVMLFLAVKAGRAQHPDPRRRVLLPMLAYFGGLLFLMAFLGALWSSFKYPDVTVTPTAFVVGDDELPLPPLGSVRLENVGRGVNQDQQVLLVQTRDRRNWVFPGDRYDIKRMYGLLREYNQR